jgi:hypothetical protein
MSNRDKEQLALRPHLPKIDQDKQSKAEERFQNDTLRPILKYQQAVIITLMKNYVSRHKANYTSMGLTEKLSFIANALNKDLKLKYTLHGVIIGYFTNEELEEFTTNNQALSKRLSNLLQQRITDSMMLLDNL